MGCTGAERAAHCGCGEGHLVGLQRSGADVGVNGNPPIFLIRERQVREFPLKIRTRSASKAPDMADVNDSGGRMSSLALRVSMRFLAGASGWYGFSLCRFGLVWVSSLALRVSMGFPRWRFVVVSVMELPLSGECAVRAAILANCATNSGLLLRKVVCCRILRERQVDCGDWRGWLLLRA